MRPPRRSLVEHFAPPAGMIGYAGWVCGFSADEACLDVMIEQFTGMGEAERARLGETRLALALDPGNPQILPGRVHGVYQLPLRVRSVPFRLMHAKVALLGFHDRDDPARWMVRLIVTTGNWTRQTLEDSIDLVWRIELTADQARMRGPSDEVTRCRADIRAATAFFDHLRAHYDDTLLTAAVVEQGAPFAGLASWLASVRGSGSAKPRFVDTRKRSLLHQIRGAAGSAGAARGNRLVLGSGFWEGGEPGLPTVPARIVETLQNAGLLTSGAEVRLILEPENCATLADEETGAAIRDEGWILLLPRQPHEHVHHRLHAKFLFCGNRRGEGESCGSAWFYLGSGNLTPAGFLQRAGPRGNLEAGVIAGARNKTWGLHNRRKWDNGDLRHVLPIDWNATVSEIADLQAGDLPPERDEPFVGAPISHLLWKPSVKGDTLAAQAGETAEAVDVLDASGSPCPRVGQGFQWAGARPVHVTVRWDDDSGKRTGVVPVIDEFGRMSAAELEPLDVETAIDMLLSFPEAGAVDPEPVEPERAAAVEGRLIEEATVEEAMPQATRRAADHHVRRLMLLVERIAERQTALHDFAWNQWCRRLECVLSQVAYGANPRGVSKGAADEGDPALAFVRALGINPLAPLRHTPFLPEHAKPGSDAFATLDHALRGVETRWRVNDLEPLGGVHD